ncbi:MAG: hypothetical protein PHH01_03315 [Patescibacteria group bacterium]|nr:hypothetical protein [Patescibacteria group bacterium]MDD5567201.1 hypothetical protein [Patescibacteria group bacterium]
MPENTPDRGKKLISWKFPEFQEHRRGKVWYTVFLLIGALSALYAVMTANFLFLMMIIIIWAVILITARRKPLILKLTITEDGLEVENRFYSFDSIAKFWLIYKPPESKYLYLNFKSNLRPDLVIQLENANPVKVRDILLNYLKEDPTKEDESLSEVLSRDYKL